MKKVFKKFLIPILTLLFFGNFSLASDGLLDKVADLIRNIAIGAAVLMIVFGGFEWMVSGGKTERISNAKERILSAILGLIIIALASTIAYLLGVIR